MTVALGDGDGGLALRWSAPLDLPAQSVDQRLKSAAWLRLVPERGGDLRIRTADVDTLERLARDHDLVVVAAGRATLDAIFEPGAARSPYAAPQRALALTYLHGMTPDGPFTAVDANFLPGLGEVFVVPALTLSGPCDILVFEGIPGGPLDSWDDVTTPEEHLARSLALLERYVPWEAARCARVTLTDANAILSGRFPPVVRRPVGRLPSGALVLGLGDTVVLNDPITGQDSNNAATAAAGYLRRIVERGDLPFDATWMQATFQVTAPVGSALQQATQPLSRPSAGATAPVAPTLQSAAATAAPAVQPAAAALAPLAPLAQAVEPLSGAVRPATRPLLESLAQPVQPVTGSLAPLTQPLGAVLLPPDEPAGAAQQPPLPSPTTTPASAAAAIAAPASTPIARPSLRTEPAPVLPTAPVQAPAARARAAPLTPQEPVGPPPAPAAPAMHAAAHAQAALALLGVALTVARLRRPQLFARRW